MTQAGGGTLVARSLHKRVSLFAPRCCPSPFLGQVRYRLSHERLPFLEVPSAGVCACLGVALGGPPSRGPTTTVVFCTTQPLVPRKGETGCGAPQCHLQGRGTPLRCGGEGSPSWTPGVPENHSRGAGAKWLLLTEIGSEASLQGQPRNAVSCKYCDKGRSVHTCCCACPTLRCSRMRCSVPPHQGLPSPSRGSVGCPGRWGGRGACDGPPAVT